MSVRRSARSTPFVRSHQTASDAAVAEEERVLEEARKKAADDLEKERLKRIQEEADRKVRNAGLCIAALAELTP
jgi:hypothetical protein